MINTTFQSAEAAGLINQLYTAEINHQCAMISNDDNIEDIEMRERRIIALQHELSAIGMQGQ